MSSKSGNARGVANVAQLAEFDDIIDARTPEEFAEDHIAGASNRPVLNAEERARVGTLYKQVSPFEARKVGGALVARNIADHLERHFAEKPKSWRPLVYCWRGGQRSGAFTHILREVGWQAHKLAGGYQSWRRHVIGEVDRIPATLSFRVLTGATGSAKSRILEAIGQQGGQVLHLEALAAHKGSVLGGLPREPQPGQKMFESRLYQALAALDPSRPVFAEAESRRIGALHLPTPLLEVLRSAPCSVIEAPLAARVNFLLRDYAYFLADPVHLANRLDHLKGLQSNQTLEHWHKLIAAGDFPTLVAQLLEHHYDPHYKRSQEKNFAAYTAAKKQQAEDLTEPDIQRLAGQMLAAHG